MIGRRANLGWIVTCVTATMASLCFAVGDGPSVSDVPKLQLSGSAELQRPADEVTVVLGVITTSAKAAEAIQENAKQMTTGLAALKAKGLTDKEYQTGSFQIDPVYTPRPRQPDPDWQQTIASYRVSNKIIVKTSRIDTIGEIIDSATANGINDIDMIRFSLKDPRAYRDEAITQATANALSDARVLAKAAGIRLVRILSISLDSDNPIGAEMLMNRSAQVAYGSSGPTTPIAAGDVTVTANVRITFEIQESGDS